MKQIKSVLWLRAFACIAVALYHFTNGPVYSKTVLRAIAWRGWVSIDIFFIVSGFIIPWALYKSNYRLSRYPRFLLKRLIRLHPPYLISILVVVLVPKYIFLRYPFVPPLSVDWAQLALHTVYLPALCGKTWLNPVYWSLAIEFQYYLLVGLMFPFVYSQHRSVRAAAVCSFIGAGLFFHGSQSLVLGVAPFLAAGLATSLKWCRKIGLKEYLFYLCIIVAVLLRMDRLHESTTLLACPAFFYLNHDNRVIRWLSDISFSFYLLHGPAGGIVINSLGPLVDNELKAWLLITLGFAATLVCAHVFYRWVEKPCWEASKRITYEPPGTS